MELKDTGVEDLTDIRQISRTGDGRLAVAAVNGLAVVDLASGTIKSITREKGNLRQTHVRTAAADKEGRIWAGTEGHGIDIYDRNLHYLVHLDLADGLPSNYINDMALGSDGRIYVATLDGVAVFSTAKGKKPRRVDVMLKDQRVRTVMVADNTLWITTSNRLMSIRLDADPTRPEAWRDYTFLAGEIADDLSPRCAAVFADGTLAFGSHHGLVKFAPNKVPAVRLPKVRFTAFNGVAEVEGKADYTHYNPQADITLKHDAATFTVAFTIADPEYCKMVEYAYCMDDDRGTPRWYATGGQHTLTFHNLPPGKHLLKISARLPNNHWDDSFSQLQITVLPPWWLTKGMLAIYGVAILALALTMAYFTRRRIYMSGQLALERKARAQEKELGEERMRFFTNITHELRTPLSLIIGPVDDLMATANADTRRKLVLIQQNAQRLLAKINTILEFRKTETRNKKLCVSQSNMRQVVELMALRYQEAARSGGVTLECHIAENEDYDMMFDTEAVTTIIDNLLSNAFKYTKAGKVTLTLKHEGENTVVSVADTGIGIAKEELPHVMERFYQAHHDPNITSTGIGLALAADLAKLHDGEITAESTLGKGSTFTLKLKTAARYPEANHSHEITDSNQTGDQRPVVLVVEDNSEIRQYIAEELNNDFLIHTASDGQQGLEKAKQLIPDLIITDVMMPRMDGMTMARQLKACMATSHIPLIILTAKATLEDRTEAYTLGAESFIPKPFTIRLLRSRIVNILERQKQIATALTAASPKGEPDMSKALSEMDREFMEKINRMIDEHINDEKLDMDFMASEVAMSYSTLYRKMKAVTGLPAGQYVRQRRVRRAAELLLTGRYTVSEVAAMTGWNAMSNFRQCFKEEMGVTPSEYGKKKP